MTNLYARLGVKPSATTDEIKSAYRAAARRAHPDVQGDRATFESLRQAYEVLRDTDQRMRYDAERRRLLAQLGAVECAECGQANRISRPLNGQESARCRACKAVLNVVKDVSSRREQQHMLAQEAVRFVDEVGMELAELAADAVRASIGRVRERLGISSRKTEK